VSDLTFAEVEAWLTARRDSFERPLLGDRDAWWALDDALDDLRRHVQAGAPLPSVVHGPRHEEQR
jgi:hypothetical protein